MKSTDFASRHPSPRAVSIATSLLTLMTLLGCASTGKPAAADTVQQIHPSRAGQMSQIIIKFRDPAHDPAQRGYLHELSRDIGVTLVFVRPMSGGAYVLRVEGTLDADQFQHVVSDLAKRPEVEYVEPDRRLYRRSHD